MVMFRPPSSRGISLRRPFVIRDVCGKHHFPDAIYDEYCEAEHEERPGCVRRQLNATLGTVGVPRLPASFRVDVQAFHVTEEQDTVIVCRRDTVVAARLGGALAGAVHSRN